MIRDHVIGYCVSFAPLPHVHVGTSQGTLSYCLVDVLAVSSLHARDVHCSDTLSKVLDDLGIELFDGSELLWLAGIIGSSIDGYYGEALRIGCIGLAVEVHQVEIG